jgi:hypothetical protein
MPKVYIYKITADDGIAPCPYGGMLTLGICKPAIRRTAQAGDYLVGVGSNVWYPGKLIYVAQVDHPIPGPDYYLKGGRYWQRLDCIYKHLGGGRYRWLNRSGRRVHDPRRMPDQMNRDVGWCRGKSNAVVLPSRRFVYFGQDRADHSQGIWRRFPDAWNVVRRLQQSHLVNHPPAFAEQMIEFCEDILTRPWPHGQELDEPHSRPNARTCHDNRRSVCTDQRLPALRDRRSSTSVQVYGVHPAKDALARNVLCRKHCAITYQPTRR